MEVRGSYAVFYHGLIASSLKLFTNLHTKCGWSFFWKDFFPASIRRLSYSFTSDVHSSHFQRGFIQCQFTSVQLKAAIILQLKQLRSPFPPPLPAAPASPGTFTGSRHTPPQPLFYSSKKPHHTISLLVRQAFLSLSHLGSPRPCLLQAESILFGCW